MNSDQFRNTRIFHPMLRFSDAWDAQVRGLLRGTAEEGGAVGLVLVISLAVNSWKIHLGGTWRISTGVYV